MTRGPGRGRGGAILPQTPGGINGKVHPVEVKSGAAGSLKSLHLFLDTYRNCGNGLVFSTRPYAELSKKKLTFLPLHFAFSATRRGGIPDEQTVSEEP